MVDLRGALLARNVEYVAGQVGTRTGYQVIDWNALTVYTSRQLHAWYAPFSTISSSYSDSALVTLSTAGPTSGPYVQAINLKTRTAMLNLIPPTATTASASFVGVGMRLYAAYHDTNQRGVACGSQGYGVVQVTGVGTFAGFNGPLFPAPLRHIPTTAEPAAGVVTAGVHRIGYLVEYLSGFTGRASPDSGSTSPPSITSFTPVNVTASGSKNLTVAVALVIPPGDISAISVIMTTTSNLNQFYIVPGSRTAATYLSGTITITVDISDADLASQGIDATPSLYWLTCASTAGSSSGAPPFSASHLCLFGDRLAYKGYQTDTAGNSIDCLYVSERNNYQAITADQHLIQLPGQQFITTMFHMSGNNYIVGPHEIYSVTDTGDVPVTWPAPHLIDGRTGTLAIHGAEVAPSGQYAWIADQAGLFLFQGSPITALPVSYYQSPDWERINWGVAYSLQIRDDAGNKRVFVLVALDGSTSPSHIMTFDYTDGATYDAVRYSLDKVGGYVPGAMELIRNDLPGQVAGNQQVIELWLGQVNGTTFLRRTSTLDTTPYHDIAATAINSIYRTCPLPGRDQSNGIIQMHHGFHARLKGAGSITPIIYDIDAARSFTCRTVTLATAPDADILCLSDLRGELAFVEFATNTSDTHWQLAYLKYYASPYIIQR